MPSLSGQPNISVTVHTTATDFLSVTFDSLMQKEEQSNIILPFALKEQRREASTTCQLARRSQNNLWICVWTTRAPSRASPSKSSLDFVFAINDNEFGGYPLFIWSNYSASELMPSFLDRRIQMAALQLQRLVPAERVFSVFGEHIFHQGDEGGPH